MQPAASSDEGRQSLLSAASSPGEQLQFARDAIVHEGRFLIGLAARIDGRSVEAAQRIAECRGSIIVCGVGKAGWIGQKVAATLASTGNRAHFLHPCEAVHGDLGRIGSDDVSLVMSHSGRSDEIVRILPALTEQSSALIAITAHESSPLGKAADIVIPIGNVTEACSLGLAPSTSTTAMLAVGDAIALLASRLRSFSEYDFLRYHPGGSLGLQLTAVEKAMRPLQQCRVAQCDDSVRTTIQATGTDGRRSGAVMIVDRTGKLAGIFTDSDLARLLASRNDAALDRPIAEVMTRNCRHVAAGTSLKDAIRILADIQISELPILDEQQHPIGLLDITDVVRLETAASVAGGKPEPRPKPSLKLRTSA